MERLSPSPAELLARAEVRLREAEAQVWEEASQENLRRLEHWRAVVRALRGLRGPSGGTPPATADRTGA